MKHFFLNNKYIHFNLFCPLLKLMIPSIWQATFTYSQYFWNFDYFLLNFERSKVLGKICSCFVWLKMLCQSSTDINYSIFSGSDLTKSSSFPLAKGQDWNDVWKVSYVPITGISTLGCYSLNPFGDMKLGFANGVGFALYCRNKDRIRPSIPPTVIYIKPLRY